MGKLKSKYKWTKRISHFRILEVKRRQKEYYEKQIPLAYETFGVNRKKHLRTCLGISGVLESKHWTENEVKLMGINPMNIDFKELNEEISKVID